MATLAVESGALAPVLDLLAALPPNADTSNLECVPAATGEECGRRLVASNTIEKDGIVVAIPVECTVTATTFDRLLGRKQDGISPPVNVTFDVEDMLKKEVLLLLYAFCLGAEEAQADTVDKVLKAYISTLPKMGSFEHHPLYWERSRLERFGPLFAPVLISMCERLEKEIESILEDVRHTLNQLHKAIPNMYSEKALEVFGKEWLMWAICNLNSRSFDTTGAFMSAEKRKGLVPLIDLANHAPTAEIASMQFGFETIGESRYIVARALRAIEKGEELNYQYQRDGESEVLHFLFYYGFVPDGKLEDDLVYYHVNLVADAPGTASASTSEKLTLLLQASESLGFPATEQLVLPVSVTNSLPSSLLWAFRLKALYDFGTMEQLGLLLEGQLQITVEQENCAWLGMKGLFESSQAWYESALQQLLDGVDDSITVTDEPILRRIYSSASRVLEEASRRFQAARGATAEAEPQPEVTTENPSLQRKVQGVLDVGSGATKCHIAITENGQIVESLYSSQAEVLLRHDLESSSDETLSASILSLCEKTLLQFKAKGEELGVSEWNGIGTAVFRKAKNGSEFLSRMCSQHGLPIGVVSQQVEGQLGFLSAQAVAPSYLKQENIISWDLGGGSFQLTDSSYNVYKGPYGSTHALSTALSAKNIKFSPAATPHPMSRTDFEVLLDALTETLGTIQDMNEGKKVLSSIGQPKAHVIAIGGTTCAFRMCAMVQKKYGPKEDSPHEYSVQPWTASDIHGYVVDNMLGQVDDHFSTENFPQANMLIPKIALVIAIMNRFEIPRVTYCATNGNTEGMLLF
jgi:hypothetical protein